MEPPRTSWNPVMSEVFAGRGVPLWVMAGAGAIRAWRPVVPVQAEQVVFPVQWLLRRVGPGVRLTQAGYLPPAVVGDALAAGLADPIGSPRREVDVFELGQLRSLCTRMRLLGLTGDEESSGRGRAPVGQAAAVAFARAALTRPAVPVADPTLAGPVDALEVLVSLTGTDPLVWRRLVVPASITLGRLHNVVQGAMGWTDSHLHLFRVAGRLVGPVDLDLGEPNDDEDTISLGQVVGPGSVIGYEYDFGDSWEHQVEVVVTLPEHPGVTPVVVAGERACPPEDVGGIGGHEQLCQVLAGHAAQVGLDPEQAADLVAWAPDGYDPEHFDVARANHRIAIALSSDELAKLQQAIEQR